MKTLALTPPPTPEALTPAATYGFFAVAITILICLTWLLIVFRPKLPHINSTGQWLKILSILVTAADFILIWADQVSALPLPGWLAHAWPFVLGAAALIHKMSTTYFPNLPGPNVPVAVPAAAPAAAQSK